MKADDRDQPTRPKRQRKSTICQACGFASYQGRVCKGCKKFHGTAEDAIASEAMHRHMATLKGDDVFIFLFSLCDYVVPDFTFCHTPHTPHPPGIPPRSARDTQPLEGSDHEAP